MMDWESSVRVQPISQPTLSIRKYISCRLPLKDRIVFKILLLVYHINNGSAPDYNKSLIRQYQPARTLRSSQSSLLHIPLSKKSWGDRAFAHAGPALWNSLPQELKNSNSATSFKGNLKSHLFSRRY